MKLTIDERMKNRITGLVVIISIAVIFLPAMMKKSNQRFDESLNVSLKLPAKPLEPKVAIPNQQTLFKSIKVAHVTIPAVPHVERATQIAQARPLQPLIKAPIESVAQANKPKPVIAVANNAIVKTVTKPATLAKAAPIIPTNNKITYAVQLASFTQQDNAKQLVTRLRQQGYSASYNKVINKQGQFFQVLVGKLPQKDAAQQLQKKLVSNMQLSGIIVRANVG